LSSSNSSRSLRHCGKPLSQSSGRLPKTVSSTRRRVRPRSQFGVKARHRPSMRLRNCRAWVRRGLIPRPSPCGTGRIRGTSRRLPVCASASIGARRCGTGISPTWISWSSGRCRCQRRSFVHEVYEVRGGHERWPLDPCLSAQPAYGSRRPSLPVDLPGSRAGASAAESSTVSSYAAPRRASRGCRWDRGGR
jgi:hypothetical protein